MRFNNIDLRNEALLILVTCMLSGHTVHAAPICQEVFSTSRTEHSVSPLFQTLKPAQLEIEADFTSISKTSKKVSFLNSENKSDPKFFTEARITNLEKPDESVTASIRPRGNTSLSKGEATFPKLRVEIKETESLKDLVFQGARKFRINTHVATNSKKEMTAMGRLNNENSPLREGLAYSLAGALGLVTPAIRLADIQYIDTGSSTRFTRHALLIETDKKMAERLNLSIADGNEFISTKKSMIDGSEAAKFLLFHKLVGNDDVGLRVHEPVATSSGGTYTPLWNTTLLKKSDGTVIPTVYDLDVSTFVSGYGLVSKGIYNNSYFNLNSHEQSLFVVKLLSLRQKFTQAELTSAIAHFKSKKEELYKLVEEAYVDIEGKANALLHLDTFFNNVDSAMNISIITAEKVPFFNDIAKTESKLRQDPIEGDVNDPGFLRPGTPVVVLGQEGSLMKVAILDINYYLLPGQSSVGYIPLNTSIGKSLPAKFIGKVDYRDLIP